MSARSPKEIACAPTVPADELVGVVGELHDHVEKTDSQDDVDAAWQEEIVARLRSISSGSATLYDGAYVDACLSRLLEEEG